MSKHRTGPACFTRSCVYRREEVNEENVIMFVDLIRTFRVLQISKLIRHLSEFQLLVSILQLVLVSHAI